MERGAVNQNLERTMGRPTKYRPEICDVVIQSGREGKSRAQIAAILDVSFSTLQLFERTYPDFSAAMIRARELAQAWWEDAGQRGIMSREFNANAYSLQIRNRFPEAWRERTTVEHSGIDGGAIELASPSQIRAELVRRGREQSIDVSIFTDGET